MYSQIIIVVDEGASSLDEYAESWKVYSFIFVLVHVLSLWYPLSSMILVQS